MSKSELIEKIWSAFRNMSLDKIFLGDENASDPEYAEAAKFFKTTTREELASNPKLIPTGYANWNFISAAGWHYVLPSYLIASLEPDAADIRETVLFSLAPSGRQNFFADVYLDRVTQITISQQLAILAWFDYLRSNFTSEVAKDKNFETSSSFWHDEDSISKLVESFEPDPNAWRTQHGSYPWMAQKH